MCWVRGSTAGGGDALAPAGPALARALVGQAVAYEFGAGRDAELGEDLMQVVVDRAWAEEQLRGDVAVGQAAGDQAGDLEFLRCQLVHGGGTPLAGGFSRRSQLGLGPLGPGHR